MLLVGRNLIGLFLDIPDATVIGYAYRFLVTTAGGYCLLTLVNVVRFSIQGMGYSMIAIISGVLEMIARSIAGLYLAPKFGFPGICFAHVLCVQEQGEEIIRSCTVGKLTKTPRLPGIS